MTTLISNNFSPYERCQRKKKNLIESAPDLQFAYAFMFLSHLSEEETIFSCLFVCIVRTLIIKCVKTFVNPNP